MAEVAVNRLGLAFLLTLLFVAQAHAQEAAPVEPAPAGDVDVPPGPNVIVTLDAGARAPFAGQLFDAATATRWGNRITRYRMTIRLLNEELRLCREESAASTDRQLQIVQDSATRQLDALRQDLREQVARYEGELQRYRNPPFYETWAFAFGVGAVVTAAVAGLVAGLAVGL
jgi:hypothetical protein